ncbi:MAG TPA: ATP-binding protein [Geothrix sp.]|nr:ATP-binding protein [Geothrix sp.]
MAKSLRFQLNAARRGTRGALRVVFLYAGFSALWILLSDRAVQVLVSQPELMTEISIAKGWVFVAVTATMLFIMVRRLVRDVASRESKLQTLIHTIPDLVWLKNPGGVYLGCNRAFERFFGANEAEIIGKIDEDFLTRELAAHAREKDQETVATGGACENDEWITLAETGQRVLLEIIRTPMYDEEGALIGVLGIGRDITEHHRLVAEQARLQAQLHQSQKMELMGRFAGGVAHDYNNMLTVILANGELLLEQESLGPKACKHLDEILQAARHSADLTQQLLAFAHRRPLNPQVVDLNQTIEGLLDILQRLVGNRIGLVWIPGQELAPVRVDPTQLNQVITNLVINARDAIQGPGRILLETRKVRLTEADPEKLPRLEPGEYTTLEVTDTGCGMTPEVVAHIFEPFYTTKASGKGTGLGLALVQSIAEQNRFALQVESAPGKGSTFRLLLPSL